MGNTGKRSWEVSDEFWKIAGPLVPSAKRNPGRTCKRKAGGGRKPVDPRKVFSAMVYVLRTGVQWKALPKEKFGSASAVHRYFQSWSRAGFFKKLWKKGLAEYDDMEGIAWEWQSIDGTYVKCPTGRDETGRNPTERGEKMEANAMFWWTGVASRCQSS